MEKTHTKEELFVPHSDKAVAMEKQVKEMIEKSLENMEKNSDMKLLEAGGAEVKEDERPRLFVMAGSGTGVMQVMIYTIYGIDDGIRQNTIDAVTNLLLPLLTNRTVVNHRSWAAECWGQLLTSTPHPHFEGIRGYPGEIPHIECKILGV